MCKAPMRGGRKGHLRDCKQPMGTGWSEGQGVISETGEGGECARPRVGVWAQSLEQEVIEAIR